MFLYLMAFLAFVTIREKKERLCVGVLISFELLRVVFAQPCFWFSDELIVAPGESWRGVRGELSRSNISFHMEVSLCVVSHPHWVTCKS